MNKMKDQFVWHIIDGVELTETEQDSLSRVFETLQIARECGYKYVMRDYLKNEVFADKEGSQNLTFALRALMLTGEIQIFSAKMDGKGQAHHLVRIADFGSGKPISVSSSLVLG